MSAYETKAWLQLYAEHTPHHLDYGETTLLDMYEETIAKHPNRPALSFFGRPMTYAELDKQVRRCAAGLRAFGVRPGDPVAIMLPNCPQHIVAFWAILRLGGTVVEHNPLYTAHELRGLYADHGARVAISWDKSATMLDSLRDTTPLETIVSVNMIDAMPRVKQLALKLPLPGIKKTREALSEPAPNTVPWEVLLSAAIGGDGDNLDPAPTVSKDSIALILYTSGTTGDPKGAQLSHGNLYANLLQGKAWVRGLGDEREKLLAALPLFHAYGMTMLCTLSMCIGGELVLLPTPRIDLIVSALKKETPTWVPGVPTLYEKILDAAEQQNIQIRGIRNSFCGASTLPTATVRRWEKATNGLLVEGYGLTECSPIIVGNPMNTDRRPGYVGIPFPDTEVKIVNPDDPSEILPDGTEGEILIRGPQVFSGYLNNPEATEKSFVDGWYRTGDVGVMEPDGFIRLVARIKEVIITGGFNVYPAEVEQVIATHPDVREVAVVGRPRPDGSEDVVACITLNEGAALDPEGLKEFSRERLTRYKVPRTFYHFEELAHDQLGKIRRREVHQQLMEILQK
ncbi:AMP-binding protein [Corynebacterium poyangense]|uniref:AMP-binding protein n=1 Tax=Corynebacterium poyangense TaxID=2684405 RepID=A0A7H0SLT4_9CORY|nr:long-chain-fatty-acid--CoA ligase [Corynebacterium poyangense]QNQ89509.1 AMP-binding protein [Corynebacterium poyangense]